MQIRCIYWWKVWQLSETGSKHDRIAGDNDPINDAPSLQYNIILEKKDNDYK